MPGPATSLPLAQQQYFGISVAVMVLFLLFLMPPFSSPAAYRSSAASGLAPGPDSPSLKRCSGALLQGCCFPTAATGVQHCSGMGVSGGMGCSDPSIAGWFSLSPWSWRTFPQESFGQLCVLILLLAPQLVWQQPAGGTSPFSHVPKLGKTNCNLLLNLYLDVDRKLNHRIV